MSKNAGGRSVTDAELIRYLDDQLDEAGRIEIAARLANDGASTARLETLAAHSRQLAGWLRAVDPADAAVDNAARAIRNSNIFLVHEAASTPWLRAASPVLRAAAVVLLVAGAAMAVPASRNWLLQTIEQTVRALPSGALPENLPSPAGPEIVHTFRVSGPALIVEVSGTPAGTLVLERGEGELVTTRTHDGGGTQLTVLPSGLHIASAGTSQTTYEIEVPRTITRVLLRVAGSQETTLFPDAGPQPWRRTIVLGR